MSIVLRDADVFVDSVQMTTQIRATALEYGAEALDDTTLGAQTRSRTGGLKTWTFSHEGFWQATSEGGLDAKLFEMNGRSSTPVTVGVNGSSFGALAYLGRLLQVEYNPRAAVGELLGYNVSGQSDNDLVRGVILRNTTGLTSSNSTGTGYQLGTSTGGTVHASLHVLDVVSDSTEALVVTIESDSSSGFGSATTRITFTATTSERAEYKTFETGTTDDWWRQNVTSPTSSGEFSILLSLGLSTL